MKPFELGFLAASYCNCPGQPKRANANDAGKAQYAQVTYASALAPSLLQRGYSPHLDLGSAEKNWLLYQHSGVLLYFPHYKYSKAILWSTVSCNLDV